MSPSNPILFKAFLLLVVYIIRVIDKSCYLKRKILLLIVNVLEEGQHLDRETDNWLFRRDCRSTGEKILRLIRNEHG